MLSQPTQKRKPCPFYKPAVAIWRWPASQTTQPISHSILLVALLSCAWATLCRSYLKIELQSVLRRLNGLFWLFVFKNYLRHVRLYEMYQFVTSYIKWNYNFWLPPSWMWALLSTKLKKETLRWPHGHDKITSRCVHVLGFVYGKQEEMPARVVVPSSCHRARGTANLCMKTRYVLQTDSSENDEVFKFTLFWKKFRTASKMLSIS